MQVRLYLVRFPNCHECQLGFQNPKKWEKNYIAAVAKLGKLTSSVSQEKMSGENKFSKVHGFLAGRPNLSPRQSSFRLEVIKNEMRIAWKDKVKLESRNWCQGT